MAGGFSSKRLALVLRRDVEYHWQAWLKYAAMAGMAWFTFLVAAYGHNSHGFVNMTSDSAMRWKGYFLRVFLATAMVMGASLGGLNTWRTDRRTALLMLPATRFEKFAAWLIEITVGMMLIALAAIVIADALHFVCSLAIGTNGGLRSVAAAFMEAQFGRVPAFTVATAKGSFSFTISSVYMATMSVWLQSLFMAGFTLRSRLRLLFIALVAFGGVVLGSVLFTMQFAGPARDTSASIAIAVFSALIVINYLITYRWFGRLQLAEQKHGMK